MVILCDSKDKKNEHILEEFDKQKIEYKTKSLKTGDYSFLIKACPELGNASITGQWKDSGGS